MSVNVSLPIDERLPELVSAVQQGNVVLVAEPGAGKTTRLPRALLQSQLASRGTIVVLEPRRLATRMAAQRVAYELDEPVGRRVGYTVRFERVGSDATRLRFVTEGVLTRRLVDDPTLSDVSVVVLDEFHERSIHADVALSLVRQLQRTTRPDLRIVVMSATLSADRLASFLDAKVFDVKGKPFGVTIEYEQAADDRPLDRKVAAAVRRALGQSQDGHVLVFLPGAREIRACATALKDLSSAEVLTLHGDLPAAEQDRAVRPSAHRKVILSTNVAETSLTIDGVTAVVDSGLARVARHSPWSGLPSLDTVPISQASATQRAGRAGRTRDGHVLRLYTKHDFDRRTPHDAPEIARSDLSSTILSLAARDVRDFDAFPFFEPPPAPAVAAARQLLERLQALAPDGRITPMGRSLLDVPLHPRLARALLEAHRLGHGERGAFLVALLSERDAGRGGPLGRHAPSSGPSDALHRLEAMEAVEWSSGITAASLRSHDMDVGVGLSVLKAREPLVRALERAAGRLVAEGVARETVANDATSVESDEAMSRALLAGFADRVGKRRRPNTPEIVFAGGGSARLANTSVVTGAEFLVAIEVEQIRGAAEIRTASAIEPEWLLEMFPSSIEDVSEIVFDAARERLEKISGLRYLGLSIDESRSDAKDEPAAAAILAKAAMEAGLHRFLDVEALTQLQRRLSVARQADPTLPSLQAPDIERLLRQLCIGRRSLSELEGAGLYQALLGELGTKVLSQLDRHAPGHVTLPGRAHVEVHYEEDRPPWIESRLQDFFGCVDGPRIGTQPAVLHLLAPNHRAVQVTTDLAGFWVRHYPAVRKELMRRYPRHAWPEDPKVRPPTPPRGR